MRILGIDPGVATVGFGVIEAQAGRQQMIQYGAITTPAGQPLAARLVQIAQDMETLITQFQPDEMSIEELFFSKNITTGIAVAHAGASFCTPLSACTCRCMNTPPCRSSRPWWAMAWPTSTRSWT